MATAVATVSTRTSGVKPFTTITITGGTSTDRLTLSDIADSHSSLSYSSTTGTLTQADSTGRTYFIGTSGASAFDTYVEIPNGVVQLFAGDGDTTSKFIFGSGADVVIGEDNKAHPAYNGRLILRAQNYFFDSDLQVDLCEPSAKMVCHGEVVLAGNTDARFQVQNSHDDSDLNVVYAGSNTSVDFYATTPRGINIAPGLEGNFVLFGYLIFKGALAGTGSLSVSEIVVSGDNPRIIVNPLHADLSSEVSVNGLLPKRLDTTSDPVMDIRFNNTGGDDLVLELGEYRGNRDDANFVFGANTSGGHMTVRTRQKITVKLVDPTGSDLTGTIRVKHANFTESVTSNPPELTVVADGTATEGTSVTSTEVDVIDKVILVRGGGAASGRTIAGDSNVVAQTPTEVKISAWAWGRQLIVDETYTLTSVGEREIALTLAEDPFTTSSTSAGVPSAAASSDDIYDILAKYAIDNMQALAGSEDGSLLDVGSRNVTLGDSTAVLAVSSTAITIPCSSTVSVGSTIFGLRTTGTVTISDSVDVQCVIVDSTGKRIRVYGLPANHDAVVGAWPSSQGEADRSNIITGEVASTTATSVIVTLAEDTEYYILADAVSYLRSSPVTFDPSTHRDLDMPLRRITDAAGNDLIPSSLTTDETTMYDHINYDITNDVIKFGAASDEEEYTFNSVARKIEESQSSTEALSHQKICLFGVGTMTFEAGTTRQLRREDNIDTSYVPDLSAFQFTQIGVTDPKDFVDYSNGAIIVEDQAPAVVSLTVDQVSMQQTTFDDLMDGVPDATKDTYKGTGGGGGGSGPTVSQIVTGIKDADFPSVSGEADRLGSLLHSIEGSLDSSTSGLAALKTLLDAIPTDSPDVSALTDTSHGLAALKTLIDAIPTDTPDVGPLTDTSHGLAALKTLIDAIPTDSIDVGPLTDSSHGLAALKTLLDAIPTDSPDVSALTDTSHGLAALKTLIDAIPTDSAPSASSIADEVRQISVETGVDLQAALRVLLAVVLGSTAIDTDSSGRTRATFKRLDSSETDAARVSVTATDGERAEAEVL